MSHARIMKELTEKSPLSIIPFQDVRIQIEATEEFRLNELPQDFFNELSAYLAYREDLHHLRQTSTSIKDKVDKTPAAQFRNHVLKQYDFLHYLASEQYAGQSIGTSLTCAAGFGLILCGILILSTSPGNPLALKIGLMSIGSGITVVGTGTAYRVCRNYPLFMENEKKQMKKMRATLSHPLPLPSPHK